MKEQEDTRRKLEGKIRNDSKIKIVAPEKEEVETISNRDSIKAAKTEKDRAEKIRQNLDKKSNKKTSKTKGK